MKNWRTLVFGVIALIGLTTSVRGEKAEFSYDSKGRRDPFVPLDLESAPVSPTDFRVEGIIHDPSKGSLAIINGKVVQEGDLMGTYRVESISRTKVVLSKDEEWLVLRLAGKPREEQFGAE